MKGCIAGGIECISVWPMVEFVIFAGLAITFKTFYTFINFRST